MAVIRRRSTALIGIAAASALVLSGCASGEEAADGPSAEDCEKYSEYLGNEGTEVEIYTTIVSPEAELFNESFAEFEACTGIDIVWNGSGEFEAQLPVRVAGGTAPDLAVYPQPGLLNLMVQTGEQLPAPAKVEESVDANYSPDWKLYGTIDGEFYAAPLGANVKSFVWYSPVVFEENGWEIPTTWPALLELTEEIATTSDVQPWCVGFESDAATGWVGTDWMEDLMLRFQGGEVYDQWISNEIPFNDPAVLEVIQAAGEIIKNPDYVGDVPSIATVAFQDAGAGLVDGTCAMHRQASFIGGILRDNYDATIVSPEDTDVQGGITTFYFPGLSEDDRPALGGGEFVGAFSDRPEVVAVQHYLTTAMWNNDKAALGGWFSPHLGLDTANIEDPVNKVAVDILQNATLFRFDASDLMPAEVGADSFWKQMTAWVAEDKSDQAVLDAIQASWPSE